MQTGLDLIDFPTIIWGEVDYSIYVMRQASRRSWRIGQTRPVKVVYMSYRNTLQADALKLVAKKLQSSLAVEGELPEDGLAAFGDDGDDMMMALARKIVSGEDEDETMEEVFAQARDAESAAEELLVDDGWKPMEVEAETVAVNGNGHDDLFGIGPTVELVPANGNTPVDGNGHAPAPVNGSGNGRHEEAEEPQQTLFSWAEFMAAEQVRPKRRGPQAPARNHLDVRVGADTGAGTGGRAGRRGTLDHHTGWRTPRFSWCPPPCSPVCAAFLRYRRGRSSIRLGHRVAVGLRVFLERP